jgi:membrane-bound serine protease (ClpP class)
MRWINWGMVCLLTAALTARGDSTTLPTTKTAASKPVVKSTKAAIVVLHDEINEFTRASVLNRINEARSLGADTVILVLNTPGGMVGPALDISRFLKRQDDLHIIAYVEEMAYSAGAMIALACDEVAMQPGSFIGDCAPIVPGQQIEGAERAKIESPLLAEFRDSAARNGYDPLLAQSMVQYGMVVHYIENGSGERRFVSDADYDRLLKEGWKPVEGVRNPVDGPNELLTVNADEAEKLGLSRGQHRTPQSLADDRGLLVIATLRPGGGENIIGFLSSSAVRGILGVVFMLALFSAFRTPGMGYPEAIAVGALALMVGVPMLTGYAQWYEILAIVIGIILLAVELFVLPGFGVTGISGIILILAGLVMTFVPSEPIEIPGVLPSLPGSVDALKQGVMIIVGGMFCSLLLWVWLQRYLPSMPYLNKLILTGGETAVTQPASEFAPSPAWPAVGAKGKAVTDLRPGGSASFFDDDIADARIADVVSDSGFVRAGAEVVVRETAGNRVVVRTVA